MSLISVKKVPNYDYTLIKEAVDAHFAVLEVEKDLRPGLSVLIKPNLVMGKRPEYAATSHPVTLRAVIDWLRERGVTDIVIADSPGGPHTAANLRSVYGVCGLRELSDIAELNYNTDWRKVDCPEGFQNASFNVIEPVIKADYIINMAKLKTHSMTRVSAGIKNMFGSVPGLQKPEMHYVFKDIKSFSNMLLELCMMTAPDITLLDAIDCMEGNGPTGGTVRHVGLMMASRDVFAQDWYAASLIGVEQKSIHMLRLAVEKGWLRPEEIETVGDMVDFEIKPFTLPDSAQPHFLTAVPKSLRRPVDALARTFLRPVPRLKGDRCVGCGKCAESCPPKIIKIKNGKARFKKKDCISCFCCQEMCPAQAIKVKRRLM